MTIKWYEIKAQAAPAGGTGATAEIYIYGNIGDRWNEDGVVASELVKAIAALNVDAIHLRINSYGGSVSDGFAIYNALRRHRASVHTFIDGVAISMASYIAMAGDKITMAANAQMMVHAPWGVAVGNAAALREEADVLERHGKAMVSAYAKKTGKTADDILALITDGKDHWFLPDEAVAEGFADEVGDDMTVAAALASSFDLSRFKTAPPSASANAPALQARDVKINLALGGHACGSVQTDAAGAAVLDGLLAALKAAPSAPPISQPPAAAGNPLEHPMPDLTQPAAPTPAPFARTKDDNAQVLAMFKPFAQTPAVAALQTEVLADPGLTIEAIQAKLLVEIGKGAEPANPQGAHPRVDTVEDEADKRSGAIVQALLVRAGVEKDAKVRASLSANPYRGHKLLDVARASLSRAGVKTDGMSQMEIVASAFTQGTSDFPVLLENTMHKSLLAAYALAALTWQRFCATGSVSDFRAHNRYRLGSFGSLDAVNELGEFTNKTIPDGEKAVIQAGTKGNIVNLSRKAVIDDDLGAFVGLSSQLGWAAARTVEVDVYATLALNGGLGPVMTDGKTLFHVDHGNIGAPAALTMAAIDADRVLMASQKDISGNDFLDIRPAVLLVPIGLGGTARSINEAQYDPDTANKLAKPNVVNGLFRDIVDTPRLSGTRRYQFADASEAPVIEVAFLDGAQEPYLELQNGFDVDGARYKVRLDYGIAAVDYRGASTNAGA